MANSAGAPRRIFRRSAEPLAADVSLIASEFLAGFQLIQQIDRPAVSIFGSARIAEGSPTYEQAQATGRAFAEAGFAVVTGGGPGVMEAANRGCKEGGGLSVGFNIALPLEQGINAWCDLALTFDRRLWHAGRTVGGADSAADEEDRRLPDRSLRLRLLGRDARVGA